MKLKRIYAMLMAGVLTVSIAGCSTPSANNGSADAGTASNAVSTEMLDTPALSEVVNGTVGVTISWKSVSGAERYSIFRKTAKENWKSVGTSKSTSFIDKSAVSGTTYTYTVRCVSEDNTKMASDYEKGKSILYLSMPKLVDASSDDDGITIEWEAVTGANGYFIYRKSADGEWSTHLAQVKGGDSLSYTDTTAESGDEYVYTVRAYNNKTMSGFVEDGISGTW